MPAEPDVATTLAAGAALVICSGDKLLGGPQAGLLLGEADLVHRLRGPATPTARGLATSADPLHARAHRIAERLAAAGTDAVTVPTAAAVGGGGAPGVELASAAVSLLADLALPLRTGRTAVLGWVEQGRCLLDLLAVDPADDERLATAVLVCAAPVR